MWNRSLRSVVLISLVALAAAGCRQAKGPDRPPRQETPRDLVAELGLGSEKFPVVVPFADQAALKGVDERLTSHKLEVRLDRRTYDLGDRLTISVRYSDIPAGAGLKLSLVRDVGSTIRSYFPGEIGPLQIELIPISGSGQRTVHWTATEVACAPTDAPMMCGPVTAGRYRIEATVYERADFLTVGWPPRPYPAVLEASHSDTLRIKASPPLDAFEPDMRGVALQYARAAAGTAGWRDTEERPLLVQVRGVRATRAGFCADWALQPPLMGQVRTCAPSETLTAAGLRFWRDEIAATGDVEWAPGVLRYSDAARAGLLALQPSYVNRVRPAEGTELSVNLREAAFRADLDAWVIRYSMNEGGGSESLLNRLNEEVAVCVGARTSAVRIIQAAPARSLTRIEPSTWAGPCPA